jgi:hypothetical protein
MKLCPEDEPRMIVPSFASALDSKSGTGYREAAGLASKLKPFKIVADLMQLKLFKTPDDLISFEMAEIISQWHGCKAIQTFLF